jgi:hypothetical protein
MPNAYYSATISDFLQTPSDEIIGALTRRSDFGIDPGQRDAWLEEIDILQSCLPGISGAIHLEFVVPRIGSRIDAVLIANSVIIVLEFKVGERQFEIADYNQAWDYALDLKNFHSGSHNSPIVPFLVATEAMASDSGLTTPHSDRVYPPIRATPANFRALLTLALAVDAGQPVPELDWAQAPYRATPTIVEAAQVLFAGHSVDDIARNEAGVHNLGTTSKRVEQVVELARQEGRKAIVFVTGVPGAGKTLVGLNIATKRRDQTQETHAVFLSGNGPLVSVLRAALTRDAVARRKEHEIPTRRGEVAQEVKAFIQNVHHFRDEGLNHAGPPNDHVVIFDEAQRAWNLEMTADFMRRKKGRTDFDQSEPEFLLSCLDRHRDWAVVVCLVGGGQEINRGEAGIAAWLEAVRDRFPDWVVFISSELTDSEYAAGHAIESLSGRANVVNDPSLHLAVSVRSFRSENVSRFVKAVLDVDTQGARAALGSVLERYPLVLTRDLGRAKRWIRKQARGSERYGIVVSSGAQRLKPHAIDVRVNVDPVHWFLDGPEDTRSSYYLEDAATEFQIQGLELDWTCVTWDADLRYTDRAWAYRSFRGSRWTNVLQEERQQYLRNAYRVLLTRARQGMVICVPEGDLADQTRRPEFYDATYQYLSGLGIPSLMA